MKKSGFQTARAVLWLAACACLLSVGARAAFDKGGVLGVGARPLGMGDAFVAIAQGNDTINWNPAGLIQVPRMSVNGFFGPLLNGKEDYFAGSFVMPSFEDTAIGFGIVSLYHNTGDPQTDAYENDYELSFATPLNVERTVSFGVNLKFLNYLSQAQATYTDTNGQQQTVKATAGGLGMDLGFLYQVPLPAYGKKINFGFFAQDLDTVLNWQSGSQEQVPLMISLGTAYWLDENIVVAADADWFNDTNISGQPLSNPLYTVDANGNTVDQVSSLTPSEFRPHLGIEGWFFDNHLGLRTGYTSFVTTSGQITGGVSYKTKDYELDYAYIGHAEHLGDSHRISASYFFGANSRGVRVVSLVQPPTGLKVAPANNSVNLVWTANPDPHVTGYTIYMSKAPGRGYIPIQKRIKDTQVTIDGLTNGTRYYFVVTSVNDSWPSVESAYSAEVSAIPAPIVPGAPVLGSGASTPQPVAQTGEIVVKGWLPPTGNIAGYNIYMSTTNGTGYSKVNDKPITATSYTVHNLQPDQAYYFVLTSVTTDNPPVESRPSQGWSQIAKVAGSN